MSNYLVPETCSTVDIFGVWGTWERVDLREKGGVQQDTLKWSKNEKSSVSTMACAI